LLDVIIRGGTIIEGNGKPRYVADLAIEGDRIAAIGNDIGESRTEIDAQGLIVLRASSTRIPIATAGCFAGHRLPPNLLRALRPNS
jgi:hypothetical protein